MILLCCASELGLPEDLSAIEVILYDRKYVLIKTDCCNVAGLLLDRHSLLVLYLSYRPVCKNVLAAFLTWIRLVGPWTCKITEVLVCLPATNHVMAKSNMAAGVHYVFCYLEYIHV